MADARWSVRLAAPAELDFANIIHWTVENFGPHRSRVYRDTLVAAIAELAGGPEIAGSRARDDIMRGLRVLHVARQGRRGRNFLMYRVAARRRIEILRILHDSMDFQRHFGPQR